MKRGKKFLFIGIGLIILIGLLRLTAQDILQGQGFSVEVVDENQKLLRLTLSSDEKYRLFRPLNEISPELIEAVLLLEDQHFYSHFGVNPVSLIRGLQSFTGGKKIGGSTITMQMVRLKHKIYTRSLLGKFKQIALATVYEVMYSKDQILEAYLNLAPYGANIEGVEAASSIYFGKTNAQINLLEALTLAVIPQNPLRRSLNQSDHERINQARLRLVEKWLEKYPEQKARIADLKMPVLASRIAQLPFRAPHFVEEVLRRDPSSHRIQTTLSLPIQTKLEQVFNRYLERYRSKNIQNGALLLVHAPSREVKAWIGSGSYFNSEIQGQIDGVSILRSPGSTLKPLVYGLAMDQGLMHPQTLLKDTPANFGSFDPENFDRKFKGPLSATEALIQSRNMPVVQLASQLNPEKNLYQILKKIGVEKLGPEKRYGLGVAIGVTEISNENLASLYTALANQGNWAPLRWKQENKKIESLPILSKESAYLVLDMLAKTARENDTLIDQQVKSRFPMAWKTGTSYGLRDAWTAGVFGPYVLVVWLGNFDFTDNPHLIGREIAAPLFFEVASLFSEKSLQEPQIWNTKAGINVSEVEVCSISGHLPGDSCPHRKKSLFIPGVSPIQTCELHRQLLVSKKTGQRICRITDENRSDLSVQVFEFWPSDLLDLFRKFGITRARLPTAEAACGEVSAHLQGKAPEIVSPKKDLKYVISYQKSRGEEKIPLRALVDGDVKKLNWFINQKYQGSVPESETFYFSAGPGSYEVVVVDDFGRSSSRQFQVELSR